MNIISIMPNKSKLSNKVVNFQLPKKTGIDVSQKGRKTLDQIWHLIVAFVMDYPEKEESSDMKLWEHFRPILKADMSYESFKNGLQVRKIGSLRSVQKSRHRNTRNREAEQGSVNQSLDLTKSVVESFEKKRQRKAIMHLNRMDVIVERAAGLLEHESKDLVKNPEKGVVFLEGHLDRATKLHKLAGSVYNIDQESKEDLAKRQLAIITNFDPFANLASHSNQNTNHQERSVNGKVVDE